MDANEAPAAESRPTDKAEDRKALRELKEKSDHLDEVIGEAREAVREARKVQTVGTEQPAGQAESGVVGGDAEKPSSGEDEADSTATPADDKSAAGAGEPHDAE